MDADWAGFIGHKRKDYVMRLIQRRPWVGKLLKPLTNSDMIWGMRYLLAPAILVTLSLVISNSISISVRERRTELAVLKVLGFRPNQILTLVLGEAVLIGVLSGIVSAGLTYGIVNFPRPYGFGGIKFPIAFFSAFMIPTDALWWGPALGAGTAFIGSVVPAWSARSVKVSEVFSRVG